MLPVNCLYKLYGLMESPVGNNLKKLIIKIRVCTYFVEIVVISVSSTNTLYAHTYR